MELIKHLAQIDKEGNLHLDIKTNLPEGEVEIRIKPRFKPKIRNKYLQLSQFFGSIKFDEDGLVYQKRIRDEWR